MNLTLESLGFSKEDLQERVIDQICSQVLSGKTYDEDGNEEWSDSQFKRKLDERIKAQVEASISAMAAAHVLPNVGQYIENLMLQETNKWGEAKGTKVTFVEYLVQRAEAYIQEQVDYDGKSKSEKDSYNWSGRTTRIAYLVNAHLHYHIETAMKEALKNANSVIVGGIEAAAKAGLQQALAGLKVAVQTAR
jgi:hypothetical protein